VNKKVEGVRQSGKQSAKKPPNVPDVNPRKSFVDEHNSSLESQIAAPAALNPDDFPRRPRSLSGVVNSKPRGAPFTTKAPEATHPGHPSDESDPKSE